MMIDIGANLSNEQFNKDIEAVLKSAQNNHLNSIILTSTDNKTYFKNIEIIEKYSSIINLKTTAGLHPHNANGYLEYFKTFDEKLKNPNVCAIGEFGLDYFRMLSTKENQTKAFEMFLDKAKSSLLPLFMHERQSHGDFLSILKNAKLLNKKIVHCFTDGQEQMHNYLNEDCYIGITGWCTDMKRGEELRKAIKTLPLNRLMIETDCPYLTPKNMPKKAFRNEPQFLFFIATEIAKIKNLSVEEVISESTKNAVDFFQLNEPTALNALKPKY